MRWNDSFVMLSNTDLQRLLRNATYLGDKFQEITPFSQSTPVLILIPILPPSLSLSIYRNKVPLVETPRILRTLFFGSITD